MSNLAVAANPPVHTGPAPATAGVSSPIATEADAAGPRGQHFSWSEWCHRAEGIEPCDGWTLYRYDEEDSDRLVTTGYFASNGERDVFFNHARFWFDPTQERFDFLVRAGFPLINKVTAFTNEDIDYAIVQARTAAQVRHGLSEAQATAIAWVLS